MKNDLLFLSGADIPFIEGTITIHQPTLYEISLIGEEALFTGCELLKFSKEMLTDEDKIKLIDQNDFHILMSIMSDNSDAMHYNVSCAELVLDLLFPFYERQWIPQLECLAFRLREENTFCGRLDKSNFEAFKQIIIQMFCLSSSIDEYNAQGELAKKIADKFKKRKQQLATLSSKPNKVAIFSRYISILTVGEHKDINSFMKYTVYQLFDEFQRFQLKMGYDTYVEARMAGAKNIKEPEDWMKDIHE